MVRFNPLKKSTIEELRTRLTKSESDLARFETAEAFFFIESNGEKVGHTKGLILDLRDNEGGLFDQAVELLSSNR